jgi:uncharacterized protein YicC (UPF0701 family)
MTGFGKGEYSDGTYKFTVEIKTVNNRYNDIHTRMSRHIRFLEEKIRKSISEYVNRGRIDISINMDIIEGTDINVKPNIDLALKYKKAVEELSDALKVKDNLTIKDYTSFNDVIEIQNEEIDEEKIWNCLKIALEEGLENLNDMRIKEGNELAKDINYKIKLEKRIKDILNEEYSLDNTRLYNELAIYADKVDINEEIVRLKSHIKQMKDTINQGGIIGRKLDFILQEANREINTIGSKTQELNITKQTIEIKNLIEKIREQAQNIE